MHVVVFGSGSGTNLEALLRAQRQHPFEIKALFTDRECRLHEIGATANIPIIHHPFAQFSHTYNSPQGSLRSDYDAENARLLLTYAEHHGFFIDLIVLAGYMRLVHQPLLQQFKNKILNIHPADLTKLTATGQRRYVGAHAVRDALLAGETRTRSTVILVDEQVDNGPILVEGPWITYEEGFPITEERVRKHQEKQKTLSDWPACITAVSEISQGRIEI